MGVTQKTAWFMLQRARLALQGKNGGKLSGEIEADESFIGGKARNMHPHRAGRKDTRSRAGRQSDCGGRSGTRRGDRAKVVTTRRKAELYKHLVARTWKRDRSIYTDELQSYDALDKEFNHQVIDHAETYVNGQVHTNGCENFWSLLKRDHGTYVSVEPFHLFRYVDEQAFRYNIASMKTAS